VERTQVEGYCTAESYSADVLIEGRNQNRPFEGDTVCLGFFFFGAPVEGTRVEGDYTVEGYPADVLIEGRNQNRSSLSKSGFLISENLHYF
jgi:hypothetical protein